jgi:hypothetical protein
MVKCAPGMRPLALYALRRLTLYAFVLAALLLLVPWALREAGLIGPSVADEIASAARTIQAARDYGASDNSPELARAERDLGRARDRAAAGDRRGARDAAGQARRGGLAAQRGALARQEELRGRARVIVDATDDRLNELEDLYAQATPGKDKATVSSLLSLMKVSRQEGAGLFLAYEEADYSRVVSAEPQATASLQAARETLLRARDAGPSARRREVAKAP